MNCTIRKFILSLIMTHLSMNGFSEHLVVSPAYPSRYLPITEVGYTVDGNPVVQTTEASGTTVRSAPVYVTNVVVSVSGGGTRSLDIFNFHGAQIRDANGVLGQTSIQTTETGIGVVDHNGLIQVQNGKAAFEAALVASTQNNNILNYIYYDGANTTPAAAYDFDLLFYRAFETNDAFLIQERNGNTFFSLEAIGVDGNVISGANKLVIGGNTDADPEVSGSDHERYDWETGYALSNYQSTQPVDFTVVETELFFRDTAVEEANQVVYGFRVDNNGNADVKFFGLSDDTFENNPINPVIPEATAVSMILVSAVSLMAIKRIFL